MKEESEIFEKWLHQELQIEDVDPLEYIAMRDSLNFQCYLLNEQLNEIVENLPPLIKPIYKLIRWISHFKYKH